MQSIKFYCLQFIGERRSQFQIDTFIVSIPVFSNDKDKKIVQWEETKMLHMNGQI